MPSLKNDGSVKDYCWSTWQQEYGCDRRKGDDWVLDKEIKVMNVRYGEEDISS